MAHDVFVSYSNKDKPVADAVVARLEQDGVRCWVAPRDITPGTSWGEAIVDAIGGARVMVLVLSANSNRSRQVVREVERAVAGDVIVLPFRIENIDPTGAMAYFLGTEHWLDAITPPVDRHIARLARTVKTLVSGEVVPREQLDTPPAGVGQKRRSWLPAVLGGTAAIAAVVVGVVLAGVIGGSGSTTTVAPTSAAPTTTLPPTTLPPVALEEVGGYEPIDLDPTDLQPRGLVTGMAISGAELALANGIDGVTRVSIADPSTPLPIVTYGVYDARGVAMTDEWIFAIKGENASTVEVFDHEGYGGAPVSLPSGDEASFGDLSRITVAGEHVYVAGHNYVGIIDVTDPHVPVLVFEWEPPGHTAIAASVTIDGDIGYFAAGADGLYVFDVADPASPALLGHWNAPGWANFVVVDDDLAYVTLGNGGMATLDVADPASPRLLGTVEIEGFSSRIGLASGHAFVSWFGEGGTLGGIAVIDVRDPAAPTFVDTYGRWQTITGLAVANGHLIITEESQGIVVYEITGLD